MILRSRALTFAMPADSQVSTPGFPRRFPPNPVTVSALLFVLALFFNSFQLVGQNAFAIVQQTTDQCAFAIIYTTCGYKS
jgi:hypothetical protein